MGERRRLGGINPANARERERRWLGEKMVGSFSQCCARAAGGAVWLQGDETLGGCTEGWELEEEESGRMVSGLWSS